MTHDIFNKNITCTIVTDSETELENLLTLRFKSVQYAGDGRFDKGREFVSIFLKTLIVTYNIDSDVVFSILVKLMQRFMYNIQDGYSYNMAHSLCRYYLKERVHKSERCVLC